MENGGEGSNRRRVLLAALVREFNGDTEAAVTALRQSTLVQSIPPFFQAFIEPATLDVPKKPARLFSDAPVLLSVQNVTKQYTLGKQKVVALNNVNLTIHQGEFIAITGASGSGKSTLLQLLGGLDKPTSGEILIGQTSIAKLSDRKLSVFRRQTVGFVFQFFYLQPFLRLKQNLAVPGMFARSKRKERARRVEELAQKVGLGDRLNHYPKELSGGQMQRAAIARALLNNPKVLLADEPTGNLDSQNGKQIIDLFESIRDEFGMTVVIVTHDPTVAARADRVVTVADGSIA